MPLSVITDHAENHRTSKRLIPKTHKSVNKILKLVQVDTQLAKAQSSNYRNTVHIVSPT